MNSKTMASRYCSRRQFLVGSGTCLMLPPLISLMPKHVLANMQAGKKVRVITGVSKYGIDAAPRYPDNSLTLNTYADAHHTHYRPFSDMTPKVSHMLDFNNPIFSGLAPKTNLIRGLSLIDKSGHYQNGSHGAGVLSGTVTGDESTPRYGASIDTIIERKLGVKAIRLKSHSRDNKVNGYSFWRSNPAAVRTKSSHIFGDQSLFNTLFSNGTVSAQDDSTEIRKQTMVDNVLSDLNSLMAHQRISNEDRMLLDGYTTSIQELQNRIAANQSQMVSCNEVSMNFEQNQTPIDYAKLYDNYFELMSLAFQCDQVRVFHFGNSAVSSNYAGDAASNSMHHDVQNGFLQADKKRFFLERLALLAKKLDAVVDPFDGEGKTLLDNSLILHTADLGSWSTAHAISQIPALTFGSGGGYFKTGYFVDYRLKPYVYAKGDSVAHTIGRPYLQLLISIMQAAGLQESQYIGFGDGSGFGEFSATIAGNDHFKIFESERNDPLPFLSMR